MRGTPSTLLSIMFPFGALLDYTTPQKRRNVIRPTSHSSLTNPAPGTNSYFKVMVPKKHECNLSETAKKWALLSFPDLSFKTSNTFCCSIKKKVSYTVAL
jgi:hypothetical protein